jgi:hypothetical protein
LNPGTPRRAAPQNNFVRTRRSRRQRSSAPVPWPDNIFGTHSIAHAYLDGDDLFALIVALAWLGDQPSTGRRADHLFDVIVGAILMDEERANPR